MANYQFQFTETPKDALDAYDAVRTASSGMRAWARLLQALFGLFYLAGVGLASSIQLNFVGGSSWSCWPSAVELRGA